MQLDNLHKHVHLNKMANGTVEVLFAGQPAMSVHEAGEGFCYTLNPVFCKLTYGANVMSDVPYCVDTHESVEDAVASGFAKLEALGAFKSMVDLPDDSYTSKLESDWNASVADATKDIKAFAAQHSSGVMEATRYASYLLGKKIKPLFEAEEVVAAFKEGSASKEQLKALYEHALLQNPAVFTESGLPIFSSIVLEEKKLENSHVETTLANNDINSKVSDDTVQVHKDNVAKARTIVKRLGQKHKVVGGLNEETVKTAPESTISEKTCTSKGGAFKAFKRRLNESLRLVSAHSGTEGRSAKVYKDTEWGEHRVKFFKDGVHQKDADYHTDDKQDARDTASHWVSSGKQVSEDRQRSEFSANSFLANAKKGTPDDMNHPLARKDKKVRIVSASGGTVSKHDSRSDALVAYKKMGSPSSHKIMEGEEAEEQDITTVMEAASKDYDAAEQKWRDDVNAKHGDKGVKFFGRVEKGVHTISAEIPGKDKSVGVWNPDKAVGHVFEDLEDVSGELVAEALMYQQKLHHLTVRPVNGTDKELLGKNGVFGDKSNLGDDEEYKKVMDAAHEYGKSNFHGKYEITHVDHRGHKIRGGSVAKVRKEMNQISERELSPEQENKREEIVQALKKSKGFVNKYGKDAIWAVATAQAKHAE